MARYHSYLLGTALTILLVAGPVGYSWYWQGRIRNFRTVRDDVLYRSGQLSLDGLKRIIHDYGIRTVITLRDAALPGNPPPDRVEEEYCKAQEIHYVRIPPRTWWAADGSVPAEKGIRRFLRVMDDPQNYPVLIHCFAGIHRSGAFCAVYRMEYQHWSNAQAIAEMKTCGYSHLDDEWDVLGYIEQYRPWPRQPLTDLPGSGPGKSVDAAAVH